MAIVKLEWIVISRLKMKKTLIFIVFVSLFAIVNAKKVNDMILRPSNVPPNAIWDNNNKIWSMGSYATGDKIIWDKKGLLRFKLKTIQKEIIRMKIFYNPNGKIERIGCVRNIKDRFDDTNGAPAGWQAFGKWKEYYQSGVLKREYCYTPVFTVLRYWSPFLCGSEILYDETGKEIKRISHKYKCEYGCDEIENAQ